MVRKAPSKSSKSFKLGTIKTGVDKKQWIVVSIKGGGKRWKLLDKLNQTGGLWFGTAQIGPIIWGDEVCRIEDSKHKCHSTWRINWSWFLGK